MEIELIDNQSCKLFNVIEPVIAQSEECRIAVAYVSIRGLKILEPAFYRCLERGGCLEFLVGLDPSGTDPRALWTLYQLSQNKPQVALYCLAELDPPAVYHPKLYLFKVGDTVTILLGSSNLTEGGLKNNIEVNVLIRAGADEEIVSDSYAVYNSLKFHPGRVQPDEEFLSLYEEMCSVRIKYEQSLPANMQIHQLRSRFNEKVASLHRPVPTERDLFGWQKLVYLRLPEGQFRTCDIYQFEEDFKKYYPGNKHIRAKIRQVLQQLRDLGLIKHTAKGTWAKG
ncbi:MAG: phospholipase D-like domain-containing protein [Candidatus Sumerlaeia bacterium]|nr:phospholipase D-like domain-containing protein [Candidatus Sumerlaeia bacterium]